MIKILLFNINGQLLTRIDNTQVVGGTYNYLYVGFNLSPEWYDININAIFVNSNQSINTSSTYSMPVINGICLVPWEVISAPNFSVSLYGFNDNKKITTNEVMIPVIKQPVNSGDIPSPPPTPTDYEAYVELLSQYKEQSDENYQQLQEEKCSIVYENSYLLFPNIGESNNIYVDTSTNSVYYWSSSELKYYCIGNNYENITTINGGDSLWQATP